MKILSKNITIPLLLLSTFIFISSCAYFNMFYNAKEHFNKAEKMRIKENKIDRKGYDNSLKELSKILEFYPDHELVDDALLMMGKCYYRKSSYSKAKRKYQELISNFKDSELVPKAKLGIAEVEIAKKNFEEADIMIKEIGKGEIGEESYDVKRLFAELSLALGDTTLAMERYFEASKKSNSEIEELTNLKIAADLAADTRNYVRAAELYQVIFEKSLIRKDLFTSRFNYGKMIHKQKYLDSAIVIYNELISNEEYANYSLEVEVVLSRLYFEQKEYEKSYTQLEEMLRVNEKTKENEKILAEASFYLGEYFLEVKRDFITAKLFYDSVGFFYKDKKNEIIKKTDKKKKIIKKHDELRSFFYDYPTLKDSLAENITELSNELSELNNIEDTLKFNKKSKELKDIEKKLKGMKKDLIFSKFALGELFLYDLDFPDSSIVYFNKVKNEHTYPHMASRAYLLEAYVYKDIYDDNIKFKTYIDSIFMLYPHTKVSNHIREMRGLEKVIVIEDTATFLYNKASESFLDSNFVEAYNSYMDIVNKFGDSDISSKVLKSAAILQEDYIKNKELAKELYQRLKKDYARSIEAKFASKKLRKPNEIKITTKDDDEKKIEEEKKMSTQDKWYLMDRRNEG